MAYFPQIHTRFLIPDMNAAEYSEEEAGFFGPSRPLIPFHQATALNAGQVVGRKVTEIATHGGTYGMGGYGYFGLELDGAEWLVVTIFGAGNWLHFNDRLVEDDFGTDAGRPAPWIGDDDALSPILVGQAVTGFEVHPRHLQITFDAGVLALKEDPTTRQMFRGNDEPRAFLPDEDLAQGVALFPSLEIWTEDDEEDESDDD